MAKGKECAHWTFPISLFSLLKNWQISCSWMTANTFSHSKEYWGFNDQLALKFYLSNNNHVHVLEILRDSEHFPSPAILMFVHFEAKTNLYFVLCVYKMVTIFLGDGKWSLDWLHFAHNFCNCSYSTCSYRSGYRDSLTYDCKTFRNIKKLHTDSRQTMAFKLSAWLSAGTIMN